MFNISSYDLRLSITAAWCCVLAATLWILSPNVPVVALAAMAVIGVTPAMVLFVLARRPEVTLAQAIQATYSDKSA